MWWQCLGNMSQIVTAAIAGFVFVTWRAARKALKRDIVNDLYREYMTEEMGKAVQALHDEFRASTGKGPEARVDPSDRRNWINRYERVYKSKERTLHYQRRMVSGFYQRAAFSTEADPLMKDTVLEIWGGNNPFVRNVLLPIETTAMPELLYGRQFEREPDPAAWTATWQRVWCFWKSEPGKGSKKRTQRLCRRLQSEEGRRGA